MANCDAMALKTVVNGSKIREARKAAGNMSRAKLAQETRTSERNIARWEDGQNQPRISSVAAIAKATGQEIDFFLTGSSEADDEDEAAGMTLDQYLRFRVRQIIREELEALL